MRNRLPLFWVKVFYYEYWPFWLFFLPLVPYWLYLALRARSLTYFTAANPGILHSGVFGESKTEILKNISPDYLPKTIYCAAATDWMEVEKQLQSVALKYPIIIKPDVGERGSQVEKVNDLSQLKTYLSNVSENFIIQEFLDLPLELGVLYYRFPDGNGSGISSIVVKEFLSVKGNGKHTLRQLIQMNERAHLQLESLKIKFSDLMDVVIEDGEDLLLQPIGNHCKGTKFLSGQHLINDELVEVFDKVASTIVGFNFGRFDLKVPSLEDLQAGRNIKIMELNGVTSEPAHIYDPQLNLFKAYRETAKSMKIMFRVSQQNRKLGAKVTSALEMIKLIKNHFGDRPAPRVRENETLSLPNALGSIQ